MHNNYSIAQTMRKQASLHFEYEAQRFLGLGVSPCRTRIGVRHRHDTDTYDSIELCDFLKLLSESAC